MNGSRSRYLTGGRWERSTEGCVCRPQLCLASRTRRGLSAAPGCGMCGPGPCRGSWVAEFSTRASESPGTAVPSPRALLGLSPGRRTGRSGQCSRDPARGEGIHPLQEREWARSRGGDTAWVQQRGQRHWGPAAPPQSRNVPLSECLDIFRRGI